MIITVTLNPAMDRTVVVDTLAMGEVNRVREGRSDPGGKGINVSRVLRELGMDSLAMGFVSGSIGRFIEASLNEIGIADDLIHTPGQTRTNLSIVEEDSHRQTSLNEPGPPTDVRYVQELRDRLSGRLAHGAWVVFAGSLPPGIPSTIYAELISLAKQRGAVTVLDTDGLALSQGVAAVPSLIKPNLSELEHLLGHALSGDQEIIEAANELHGKGIDHVVVSMGGAGAIAVGNGDVWRAHAPEVTVRSGVGAGDSLVAGLVKELSAGSDLATGLRLGMAAGAATALSPGTMLCRREDVLRLFDQVRLQRC